MPQQTVKKVILAYSGGLDTSIIVPWLIENYQCEVICFTADIGQSEGLEQIEQKALASGASCLIMRDLKDEFAEEYLFRLLRAGAVYEDKYLLGTAISRSIIAKHQIDIAHELNADAVAHGGTGKGNDQVRFELAYMALDPRLKVIAPWREWQIRNRKDAIQYAQEHNIPVIATEKSIYSRDRNLWHRSHEGGPLEDSWSEPLESTFLMSASPENAPDEPAYIEIDFEAGSPIAVNGTKMKPSQMIYHLNALGGAHGVGRMDLVESRLVGVKSRGVYETPGGTILHVAHHALESLVLDRDTLQFKAIAAIKYAELVYNGMWFSPLRESLELFMENSQRPVTGTVRLKLYKGNVIPVGRKSEFSLYREEFNVFGEDDVYDQSKSEGFINLYGLALKVRALNNLPVSGLNIPKPDFSRFKRD